ncbi:hypothetical protein OPV22_012642 [Ensete ventricosum]|uniref:MSP domain-containing protein n=2 Tax=Ensete ventricosum TaxID=4639 RepID=A0A445MER9_ENSVE|nr:hypothetical protein OPV22_012642 [Ensete ventricosum]RWW27485.1 hypothetical protein GW17_00008097 [Ensete ventricosum]RZR72765.1 hypothetical protein BHM03_00016920 [Ensete ventricosum]
MSDIDEAESTLEVSILLPSADGFRRRKPAFFLPSKPKPFAVAWIDPTAKRSTKPLSPGDPSPKLHFPISSRDLCDPACTLTVQILSSRFPFRHAVAPRVEGSASVPLSSLPAGAGDTLTLLLNRPSGRPAGFVHLSVRILWCLGAAAPLPEAPPILDCSDWAPMVATGFPAEIGQMEFPMAEPNAPPVPDEDAGTWRSFWVGLACGTLAVVLVGATGLLEG